MHKQLGLAIALAVAISAVAKAEPVIVVGDHLLLPNTPGQTIQIFVSGGTKVQAMNFNAVIGDGGSILNGVDDVVPSITADIITGTIFQAHAANAVNVNPTHEFGAGLAAWTVVVLSGTVNAEGLLATLTIDTTGFNSGSWALNLKSPNPSLLGDTDFAGFPILNTIDITNGSITIVPEPASFVLGLFAAAGLGAFAIRRRAMRRRSR